MGKRNYYKFTCSNSIAELGRIIKLSLNIDVSIHQMTRINSYKVVMIVTIPNGYETIFSEKLKLELLKPKWEEILPEINDFEKNYSPPPSPPPKSPPPYPQP